MNSVSLVVSCFFAALVAYGSTRFAVIPLLQRGGVLDTPSERSSHEKPVARGGGIGVLTGLVAGVLTAGLASQLSGVGDRWPDAGDGIRVILPVAAAFVFGIVGFVDDLNSLSAVKRLVVQSVLASGFAAVILLITDAGFLAATAIVVCIVLVVNGTNFMDGLNTLVTVWGAATAVWLGVLSLLVDDIGSATPLFVFGVALLGFLPLNIGPARSFLGDVGSYAIGGLLVVAVWVLWSAGVSATALLAPFIVPLSDVLLTLARRAFRGENIFLAHRTHVYQRLQATGLTHERVSALHLIASVLCIVGALPSLFGVESSVSHAVAVGTWTCVLAVYFILPSVMSEKVRATT